MQIPTLIVDDQADIRLLLRTLIDRATTFRDLRRARGNAKDHVPSERWAWAFPDAVPPDTSSEFQRAPSSADGRTEEVSGVVERCVCRPPLPAVRRPGPGNDQPSDAGPHLIVLPEITSIGAAIRSCIIDARATSSMLRRPAAQAPSMWRARG